MAHLSKKATPGGGVWKSWGIVILFCVLAVSFSSCDLLRDLGLIPEDEPAEEPVPGTEPAKPRVINPGDPSIKEKFGITATEKAGVTATFTTLHAYIQAGGLDDGVIRLGDWIDLEGGLIVDAYNGEGDFTATNDDFGSDKGRLLRLIVVGINSFHSGRGMADSDTITQNGDTDGKYDITDNDATPHVVFQFQNIPVKRRMNALDGEYNSTNAGGYAASEMRKYLVEVGNSEADANDGKFLAGLKNAGVPEEALWAPKRFVSDKGSGTDNRNTEISDLLWLPTEWELFGGNTKSVPADETAANQARLEYYASDEARRKYLADRYEKYWGASPATGDGMFCAVEYTGSAIGHSASGAVGCAPAFCVH
jgi:hypothetical protein